MQMASSVSAWIPALSVYYSIKISRLKAKMPTSKTTTSSISNLTNPTYNSLIVKSKNSFEFVFDCAVFVAVALNIKNHWSWRWWRRQVEFSTAKFYCFQNVPFWSNSISHSPLLHWKYWVYSLAAKFDLISFQPTTTITAATTTRFMYIRIFAWIALLCVISIHISHATPHHTAKLISNAFWFWEMHEMICRVKSP